MLTEETPIADAALPVDAFKTHLRLGSGFGSDHLQDPLVRSFLRAAIVAVEGRTAKVLIERSYSVSVREWRNCEAFVLPVAPVTAITQVEQVARDGSRSAVDAESYWLEADNHAPKLRATASSLPAIPAGGSVLVSFDAGFAVDWEGIPADLRQAVMMLSAHYYEYRNDTGLSDGCMPFGVSSLIDRYRRVRLGGGAVQ